MKIFVTGASGFIGKALVKELFAHGHTILALARTDTSAIALAATGAQVHLGDLEDLDSLKAGATACDGVIHVGFVPPFKDFAASNATDRAAIRAMGEAMEGTGKPLVIASAMLGVAVGQLATEDTIPQRDLPISARYEAEDLIKELSEKHGIRGIAVRVSAVTHGPGDHGFVPALTGLARQNGRLAYIGDGSQRWPSGHVLDTAALFRLAFEKGKASAIYNASAEEGVQVKHIAETIGNKLDVLVESKSAEQVQEAIGFLSIFLGLDGPMSSEKTRKELGWSPKQVGLLEDLDKNYQW